MTIRRRLRSGPSPAAMAGRGACLGLLAAAAPALAPAAAVAAPVRTIPYAVGFLGVAPTAAEAARFAATVDATLNDPRGWALNGAVRFRRGTTGAFRVTLAAPAAIARFGGCKAQWSCRVGPRVLVNAERWARGARTYPGPVRLQAYRQMVVEHEVGHALGFGHRSCPRAGALAPLMQEQSIALGGCRANSWPLPNERAALARRLGVGLPAAPPRIVPGSAAGGIRLGDRAAAVVARLGDPQAAFGEGPARTDDYTPSSGLTVTYAAGRVSAITTRARGDRTADGLGVGTPLARLAGLDCRPGAADETRCVLGSAARPGDTPTTFSVRDGRVAAVTVERLTGPAPLGG